MYVLGKYHVKRSLLFWATKQIHYITVKEFTLIHCCARNFLSLMVCLSLHWWHISDEFCETLSSFPPKMVQHLQETSVKRNMSRTSAAMESGFAAGANILSQSTRADSWSRQGLKALTAWNGWMERFGNLELQMTHVSSEVNHACSWIERYVWESNHAMICNEWVCLFCFVTVLIR